MTLVASFNVRVAALLAAAAIAVTVSQFAAAQELPKNFIMHNEPKPVPEVNFEDRQGRAGSLTDFKGKILLLNIWATWCVSCRHEMPALDRLQAALGGSDFEVVPLSIDRGGIQAVAKFYAETNVGHLEMYVDPSGKVLRELGAIGLPTTLIIDRGGREIGRIVGPAEWDAAEVTEILKPIIATQSDTPTGARPNAQTRAAQQAHEAGNWLTREFQWLRTLFTK